MTVVYLAGKISALQFKVVELSPQVPWLKVAVEEAKIDHFQQFARFLGLQKFQT